MHADRPTPNVPQFRRNRPVSISGMADLERRAWRLQQLSVSGGAASLGDEGLGIAPPDRPAFWARITGQYSPTANIYSFSEVQGDGSGNWSTPGGALTGTNNAYEVNGDTAVPANPTTGAVVRMWPGDGPNDYLFEYGPAATYGLASGVYLNTGVTGAALTAYTATSINLPSSGASVQISNATPSGQSAVLGNAGGNLAILPAGTYLIGGACVVKYNSAPTIAVGDAFTAQLLVGGNPSDVMYTSHQMVDDLNNGAFGGTTHRQHFQIPGFFAAGVPANSNVTLNVWTTRSDVGVFACHVHAVRLL